ncbi:MAG: mechanosensitive ion channel [Methanomassiliicoccaceae archaeon]|jgi:small-conductance mechanosensitive channel|nr:mechanosensitive ion channel [Methanomassiliicoccaceae archaeon]
MFAKRTALILAAVMVSVIIAVPLFSDDAEGASATVNGVTFSFLSIPDDQLIELRAGESKLIHIEMYNNSGGTRQVVFKGADFSRPDAANYDVIGHDRKTDIYISIEDGKSEVLAVNIFTDRYIGTVSMTANFSFEIFLPGGANGDTHDMSRDVKISSRLASENQLNRIMGLWDNPLPEPFDTALYAAAITFAIWLAIAFLAAFLVIPKLVMPVVFKKKEKENRKAFYKKIQLPLFVIILLYGITVCLPVYGAGEYAISMVTMGAEMIYIFLGAWIGVKVLAAVLDMWEKHAKECEDEEEYDVRDSIAPLFLMLGKIIIGMAATAAVLAVLGFDLMIIATGAGIIGLAISFGAQSTLAQFFGGITLLVNRPFRPGDLIRLDDGTDTLRVLNVGFMMTTFRNWANSEIFSMPNQKVVSSTIVNVTAESLAYRIIVLVRVPYGTDVQLAKRLALLSMTEHPRILQDGSEEIPKVRLEEFSDSAMTIRVSGFVDDFEDHRSIAGEIREAIYKKYRENGVMIAIPKMDIFVRDPNDKEERY